MSQLRAVPRRPSQPRRRLPRTIKAAVKLSERELLAALRAKIAAEVDGGVPAHTLAGLIKQLRDLDREIRVLDTQATIVAEETERAAVRGDRPWDARAI